MTPPPSEPTTGGGEEIVERWASVLCKPWRDAAPDAMYLVYRVDRVRLVAMIDAALGAEKDELRITKRLFENMTVRCEAAEQREREAGEALRKIDGFGCTADAKIARAALAAIRSGPAQPAEPIVLSPCTCGHSKMRHVLGAHSCWECGCRGFVAQTLCPMHGVDDCRAAACNAFAPAPVSDPPTAKVIHTAKVDRYCPCENPYCPELHSDGRMAKVMAPPTAKGETGDHAGKIPLDKSGTRVLD